MARPAIIRQRDGGWAWFVLIAAFFNLFISALPFCIGVYVNELVIEQNISRATGGLFGALQIATVYLGGPATILSERYTHRVVIFMAGLVASVAIVASIHINNVYILFVTFCILPGLCIGIAFIQSIIMMNRYFNKYAGLANGVAFSGCGLGTIVVPFIYDDIIKLYGWRQSLYIVAGCTLHACVFAMVMRPVRLPAIDETNTKSQENLQITKARNELYTDPRFYLFLVANTLWSSSMSVVFVLGANLFHESGMTNSQSSLLLAFIGIGNLGVRIAIGVLLHVRRWNLIAVHVTITVAMAFSIAMFTMHDSFVCFAFACIFFGISYGATTVTQAMVPRAITGIQNYGIAYSSAIGFCVVGISGGPPLFGFIYDKTRSYKTAFLTSTGFALLSALLLSISFCIHRCHNARSRPVVARRVSAPTSPVESPSKNFKNEEYEALMSSITTTT